MDCETTGLHAERRAHEVGLILRRPGRPDDELAWFIDIEDCDMVNAEPIALEVGRFWQRHPQAHLVPLVGKLADVTPDLPETPPTESVFREREVLRVVAELTGGRAYVMGSNPAFDTQTLAARMAVYGITPDWHYHPIDVPDRAAGWLAGQGREVPTNEKGDEKSDLIAKACGVDPADYERHSALGDCRLFRDLWDAIQKPAANVEIQRHYEAGLEACRHLAAAVGQGRYAEGASTVAVDRTVHEWLVLHALNTLWGSDQEDGCCDRCCGPCAAIRALLDTGRLDDAVRGRGPSHSWWDERNNRVDRRWLVRAWRLTGCHDNDITEPEEEINS